MGESQYVKWVNEDHFGPLENQFNQGVAELHGDKIQQKLIANPLSPWFYNFPDAIRKCDVWFSLYFKVYNFVPMGCIKCMKVCLKVPTLRLLMKILEMQEKMGLDAKCGMERRAYVPANYSAFWYVPHGSSIDESREFYKMIKKELQTKISPVLKPILKNGCTEMEKMTNETYGVGSDRWLELYENYNWGDIEKRLDGKFHPNEPFFKTELCEDQRRWLKRRLVEHAFSVGDETYRDFTNGLPLIKEPVTYHE